MGIAIFHSAYDPANSRPQRLQRDLCELPDVRLLATLYSLCAPFSRETERTSGWGRGEEEVKKTGADARRTTRRRRRRRRRRRGEAESLPLSEVLEFVRGLSAGKYDVSHLLNWRKPMERSVGTANRFTNVVTIEFFPDELSYGVGRSEAAKN
ncbi:uncharacterized protein LOC116841974 [Odontomachus brunneus]|uniref:uncharacterized protein LOC116841974 n=1 Tax=Odontomachus brunneus TaxID=486640 RepID=UPI0013F23E93|nr:uncharacterized protein LOC116841974 [Odontomachus brunneus]